MSTTLSDRRSLILRWIGTLSAVLLLLLLLRGENWSDVLKAFIRLPVPHLLWAVLFLSVSRIFVVGRWHLLLRSGGVNIPLRSTAMLTFTGFFASNFLPTTVGGDVARLAGAIRLGFDEATCAASLIADRIVGLCGMASALPFGLYPLFIHNMGTSALQVTFIPAVGRWFFQFLKRTFSTFSIWLKEPFSLFLSLCCSWGNVSFGFAAVFMLVNGLGYNTSYWLIAGIWSLAYFVTLIPVSINGLGVQEFSITFLLSNLGGLDIPESLTVAVLVRVLYIFASLPGAIFLPFILAAMKKRKTELNGGSFSKVK